MTSREPEWLERILGLEDLGPSGREAIRALLESDERVRRLVDRLHFLESRGAPLGEIGGMGAGSPPWIAARERIESEASLRLLLQRLGLAAGDRSSRPLLPQASFISRLRRWVPAPLLMPAAVAALAVLFLRFTPEQEFERPPSPSVAQPEPSAPSPPPSALEGGVADPSFGSARAPGRPAPFRAFSIRHRGGFRGGPAMSKPAEPETFESWRTGDSFYLRFEAIRDGAIVLLHIDPLGTVELLHPADASAPLHVVQAGTLVELPPADGGEEWTFEGEPGIETFVLAMGDPANWPVREAIAAAARPVPVGETPEQALARVRSNLEANGGTVRVLRVDHRPEEPTAP